MDITVDILDYLGKIDEGIIVLLSLGFRGDYYEATFFYREQLVALTPDENLEEKLQSPIEDWEGYSELMLDIIKKVIPYDEMINRVDDFDPSKYGLTNE